MKTQLTALLLSAAFLGACTQQEPTPNIITADSAAKSTDNNQKHITELLDFSSMPAFQRSLRKLENSMTETGREKFAHGLTAYAMETLITLMELYKNEPETAAHLAGLVVCYPRHADDPAQLTYLKQLKQNLATTTVEDILAKGNKYTTDYEQQSKLTAKLGLIVEEIGHSVDIDSEVINMCSKIPPQ